MTRPDAGPPWRRRALIRARGLPRGTEILEFPDVLPEALHRRVVGFLGDPHDSAQLPRQVCTGPESTKVFFVNTGSLREHAGRWVAGSRIENAFRSLADVTTMLSALGGGLPEVFDAMMSRYAAYHLAKDPACDARVAFHCTFRIQGDLVRAGRRFSPTNVHDDPGHVTLTLPLGHSSDVDTFGIEIGEVEDHGVGVSVARPQAVRYVPNTMLCFRSRVGDRPVTLHKAMDCIGSQEGMTRLLAIVFLRVRPDWLQLTS